MHSRKNLGRLLAIIVSLTMTFGLIPIATAGGVDGLWRIISIDDEQIDYNFYEGDYRGSRTGIIFGKQVQLDDLNAITHEIYLTMPTDEGIEFVFEFYGSRASKYVITDLDGTPNVENAVQAEYESDRRTTITIEGVGEGKIYWFYYDSPNTQNTYPLGAIQVKETASVYLTVSDRSGEDSFKDKVDFEFIGTDSKTLTNVDENGECIDFSYRELREFDASGSEKLVFTVTPDENHEFDRTYDCYIHVNDEIAVEGIDYTRNGDEFTIELTSVGKYSVGIYFRNISSDASITHIGLWGSAGEETSTNTYELTIYPWTYRDLDNLSQITAEDIWVFTYDSNWATVAITGSEGLWKAIVTAEDGVTTEEYTLIIHMEEEIKPPAPPVPPAPTVPDMVNDADSDSSTTTIASTPEIVTTTGANNAVVAAAAQAAGVGSDVAKVYMTNPGAISLETLQGMELTAGMDVKIYADSMVPGGNTVDVRIALDPSNATKDLDLSASTTNETSEAIDNLFSNWFANEMTVVSFGQQGSFGQTVEVAVKVDPSLNANALRFYVYDAATNTYSALSNTAYWVDANGYVHFNTNVGGNILITDSALTRR